MDISNKRIGLAALAMVAGLAASAVVIGQAVVPAGPNKLEFAPDWDKGVLYATVDRPDTKQYREFYSSADVVAAARAGRPLPDGARVTLAAYAAKVDAEGKPVKDANGRYIKDKLLAVNVQQKKTGWGADIPAAVRNGDWIYQSFTPDGKPNDKANLTACYQCHLPFANDDYLTNLAKLAGKFPSSAVAALKSGPTDVAINGFAFGPGKISVATGQSVTWTNADDTPHQVTLVGKGGRSDVMLKGQSATLKFDETGNIDYICGLHPTMKGTIEVVSR